MATSAEFCPAKVEFPPNIRRMETHVKTTSNARRNVKTRFFIRALLRKRFTGS